MRLLLHVILGVDTGIKEGEKVGCTKNEERDRDMNVLGIEVYWEARMTSKWGKLMNSRMTSNWGRKE